MEIPYEIIDQVIDAYASARSEEIDREMERHMSAWRAHWEEQKPIRRRELDEYQERFRREYEEHHQAVLPKVAAKRPERLGRYDARQLIRATQMLIHRPDPNRFPGEETKVLEEPVELFEETLTVRQIHQKYNLQEVRYAMEKVFRRDNEAVLAAPEQQPEE